MWFLADVIVLPNYGVDCSESVFYTSSLNVHLYTMKVRQFVSYYVIVFPLSV